MFVWVSIPILNVVRLSLLCRVRVISLLRWCGYPVTCGMVDRVRVTLLYWCGYTITCGEVVHGVN